MRTAKVSIGQLIVDQLARGEMRILGLVVALRKTLGQSAYIKVDLSSVVVVALRKLIASKVVLDSEGTYSLNRQHTKPSRDAAGGITIQNKYI
ncbi:MAG: hypothetical protein ABSC42_11520 [Tepidisphaeraceae bacterium]